MNDREIMSLVNRIINFNYKMFRIFASLVSIVILLGSFVVAYLAHLTHHEEVIIAAGAGCAILELILAVGVDMIHPSKSDGEKIVKGVQTKQTIKYTSWKQDENGNYYFGKNRIDAENVRVIRHTPKLSKPEAKVTVNKISNRFTKNQKNKIHQALHLTDVTLEKKQAVINK